MGCPKNEVDTNRMKTLVAQTSYELCEKSDEADVLVVNTCSFLTEAVEESLAVIFDILNDEGFIARDAKLIVTGCMPARFGEELSVSLYEASGFLPASQEDEIVSLIEQLTGVPSGAGLSDAGPADNALRTAEEVFSYVKISDGCDRFCSYCTIPFIRGRYYSRPFVEIEKEIAVLTSQGVKEIILIGQDTGIWGSDFPEKSTLAELLKTLAKTYPDTWFRVMYLQPEGLTNELLDVFATMPNVCKYLDIPLQHANPRILKEMNRSGSGEEFLEMLNRLRERVPGIALRTTLIAGFPSETRAEAHELSTFLQDAQLDYAGVFPYSQEEGTRAGSRTDQVPLRTRRARAQRFRDLSDEIGFKRAQGRVGEIVDVLVEGYENDGDKVELVGRMMTQAPEIDGVVHIDVASARIGDIVKVKLIDSFCYEYDGEVISCQ